MANRNLGAQRSRFRSIERNRGFVREPSPPATRFLKIPDVSQRLASTHGAVAIDMETAAVAEEAANSGLLFVGVRLVADMVNGSNQNLW